MGAGTAKSLFKYSVWSPAFRRYGAETAKGGTPNLPQRVSMIFFKQALSPMPLDLLPQDTPDRGKSLSRRTSDNSPTFQRWEPASVAR